jgi:hypothetical protein
MEREALGGLVMPGHEVGDDRAAAKSRLRVSVMVRQIVRRLP